MTALLDLGIWVPILDGDPVAAAMYERHYSSARSRARRQARGTLQFGGPGERMILSTPCRRALWVWRRHKHRRDRQSGVECAVFRNEGAGIASELVRAADAIADARWPGVRHFTFINDRMVGGQPAGNCFRRAGWKPDDHRSVENDLLILCREPR